MTTSPAKAGGFSEHVCCTHLRCASKAQSKPARNANSPGRVSRYFVRRLRLCPVHIRNNRIGVHAQTVSWGRLRRSSSKVDWCFWDQPAQPDDQPLPLCTWCTVSVDSKTHQQCFGKAVIFHHSGTRSHARSCSHIF